MPDFSSAELLDRYQRGDDAAAEEIFSRYVRRLTLLARSRLSKKLARRVDPEDVVLSAWRSFFVAARAGRFSLERGGDLWNLLVKITLRKVYANVARHRAEKRDTEAEIHGNVALPADEPGPFEAAALADEVEHVLSQLAPSERKVFEMRLQGHRIGEIARQTGRSERTVRRTLRRIRDFVECERGESHPSLWAESQQTSARRDAPAQSQGSIADTCDECSTPSTAPPDDAVLLTPSDYVLERYLGSGGMGKVYVARQKNGDGRVAVKVLRKALWQWPEAAERFLFEAGCVARLNAPGVVNIHGIGRYPAGAWFLVMDWMEGGDLATWLCGPPIAVQQAARWVAAAAETVHRVHAHGVVHCDLKPANLLLNKAGRLFVSDFGLARLMDEDRTGLTMAGTPGFMAPEQVDACWGEITPRTDVYGLGAVLYALLTGRPPFEGKTRPDVLAQVVSPAEPKPLSALRPDVPADLHRLCVECLRKVAGRRPSSAQHVAEMLNTVGRR